MFKIKIFIPTFDFKHEKFIQIRTNKPSIDVVVLERDLSVQKKMLTLLTYSLPAYETLMLNIGRME